MTTKIFWKHIEHSCIAAQALEKGDPVVIANILANGKDMSKRVVGVSELINMAQTVLHSERWKYPVNGLFPQTDVKAIKLEIVKQATVKKMQQPKQSKIEQQLEQSESLAAKNELAEIQQKPTAHVHVEPAVQQPAASMPLIDYLKELKSLGLGETALNAAALAFLNKQ